MTNECPKCQTNNPEDSKFCKECATPLPGIEDAVHTKTLETPTEKLTRGSTFAGRYEIIEELGKGGMGRVFRVEDTKIKQEIALKLIKSEIAADKKILDRFRNELKTARMISHPNVCRMFDLGDEKETHFITMEYVPGEDLKTMIRMSGQLGIGTAIKITKQICNGLNEAHKLGVIHRDIKPSNIMIDKRGNARIMDFGIARTLKGEGITRQGVMIGTSEYMSPEQVEGKDLDSRSDIYSLGIILYEMLTGRIPFEGDTPFTIGMKHKSEEPENPQKHNPRIPDDLSHLILKCLEKQKENRYQNAEEVCADLAQIEQGMPTSEREITRKKTLTSKEITVSFSLKRLLFPALAVFVALVVVLLIWHPWSKEKTIQAPTDKPSLAVLYFENNTGEENLADLGENISIMLTADLFQSMYLHVLSADRIYGILQRLNLVGVEKYSFEDLKKVANQGGVNHTVSGSYMKDGSIYYITVFLNRIDTKELLNSFTVSGDENSSISDLIDKITQRIKAELNLSQTQIARDIDKFAANITSGSREALKFYREAMRKQWNSDSNGAIQFYKEAIEIDPDFAMAYRGMAMCYSNSSYYEKARALFKNALELAERLPEREELQIKGDLASNLGEIDDAIQAYEELLARYPEDIMANHNLGLAFSYKGENERAIESYKKAIQYKSPFPATYWILASRYRSQGLEDKARETLELYNDTFEDHPVIYNQYAEQNRREGNYELALQEIDKALSLDPNYRAGILTKGDIYFYKGELAKAEEQYQRLLLDKDHIQYGRVLSRLGRLYLLQGRFQAAEETSLEGIKQAEQLEERIWIVGWKFYLAYVEYVSGYYDQALEVLSADWDYELKTLGATASFKDNSIHLKGLVYLKKGLLDQAQNAADELAELENTTLYNHLLGSIEVNRGNYSEALPYFEKALAQSPNDILFLYSAASANHASGDLDKAQERYERIVALTDGRTDLGGPDYNDLFAKSYYRLGQICEQRGWKGKAIENYEEFLTLWKDADPGLPEVDDAKKRLGLEQ